MDRKVIARIAGYITLFVMIASAALYFFRAQEWPYIVLLITSSWLHGICWGRLYSLEGRLTWF